FASRGIQDDATARVLTLSGSGANSITMANSAGAPIIGTSGSNLYLTPALGTVELNGYTNCNFVARSATTGTSGLFLSNVTSGTR
ncbi:hypothetical protein OFL77_27430, partial [Escherichia coli]|uniref:hypothetical protein n=1 Tax=Escherichia coli TaxID=562 RepID=UPI0021E029F9